MNPVIENELNELEALASRLRGGELTPPQFRAQSVHYGVYTQSQPDRYFVRIRVPYGVITSAQVEALATAIQTCGPGACHLTARQGIEIHDLALDQVVPLLRMLAAVDLLSHETGGNAVRGIMVCPHAGVGKGEPFDPTPYAALLTRSFVRHPDFQALPRKMKIGFSCCEADCARSAVQDLGFQARVDARGEHGFRVLVGGGTGALPRLGRLLLEFLPAEQLAPFTEAFLRLFNRLGDRQNRARARVKFLVQGLGLDPLRQEVLREWELVRAAAKVYPPAAGPHRDLLHSPRPSPPPPPGFGAASLSPLHSPGPSSLTPLPSDGRGEPGRGGPGQALLRESEEFSAWLAAQTQPQQQSGFRTVRLSLLAGNIASPQLRQLATLTRRFSLEMRTTPEQGLLLRWAPDDQLPQIYQALADGRLLARLAVARLLACPGSSSCSNAFTHAPGLAQAITARLAALPGRTDLLGQLRIRVSGCPNGCTLHALADIGLEGVANRDGQTWWPAYRILVAGREAQPRPRLATDLGMLPARVVPACVADLASCYLQQGRPDESLADLVDRIGIEPLAALVQKHQHQPVPDRRDWLIDWGETGPYRPRTAKAAGIC